MTDYQFDDDETNLLEDEEELALKKPNLYQVILHNDNYTTMEFVIFVLKLVFRKSDIEAFKIMMDVHTKGFGIAGIYTYEVASTNVYLVEKLAEENEYPFKASLQEI